MRGSRSWLKETKHKTLEPERREYELLLSQLPAGGREQSAGLQPPSPPLWTGVTLHPTGLL